MELKTYSEKLLVLTEKLSRELSSTECQLRTKHSCKIMALELYAFRLRSIIQALVDMRTGAMGSVQLFGSRTAQICLREHGCFTG
jgi:hypothetical protein